MASSCTISGAVFLFALVFAIIRWVIVNRPPPGTRHIPGPWGIPFVGRVHDVDPQKPWIKMREFSDQYNCFFQTKIMGETHLWLGDQKIAYDLFAKRAAIYSSRPMVPSTPGSDSQGQYLPLLAYDEPWRRQRKFAHTVLASGHNTHYYGYTVLEVKRLLVKLLQDPKDYYTLVDRYCSRISSRLAYGSADSATFHSENAAEFISQISPSGPTTNLMPFLGNLPEWLNPSIKDVRLRREKEQKKWLSLMHGVRNDMAAGNAPVSYARTYFERKEQEKESKSFGFDPDDREAACAVGMLCTVAIFTIGGPLNTFLLAMVLHPEWQEKAREEIDMVLGDRLADLCDSPFLPTLRAVIKECVRWRPPVPLGVPRLLQADDVYNGVYIPKGTVVHAVELAVARDQSIYPDPDTFRPERWLDPAYPTYKEPLTEHPKLMGHHQFGCGYRTCPGIALTEAEMLIACSAILWAFTLRKEKTADGKEVPVDPDRMSPNLIGGPLPFDFELKVRDEKRAQQIMNMWDESELETESLR